MASLVVLMVAEKPSIAQTLAYALCEGGDGGIKKRKGVSPSSPVYEYVGTFKGEEALFRVTATTGHVFSLDFSSECQNWDKVSPGDLFHADTVRCYSQQARIPEHLRAEARGAHALVLWLDCDREGENICFEVMGEALPQMTPAQWPDAYENCVFRAQFSSLAAVDLREAMLNLVHPDICQAHSVDARQEIDLRLGVAFSRLQTLYFRTHFGSQLGRKMVTYGPCQFPTLWFCVKRHCDIEDFVPVPYWRMELTADIDGTSFPCRRVAGEIWDEAEAKALVTHLQGLGRPAVVDSVRTFRSKISRPLPLNTVSLLRMASDELGLGPADALHIAEQLYLKGITSYPRTETNKYPDNFDLEGTVRTLADQQAPWAESAQHLMTSGITQPRDDGFDAGDHPPITPVKFTASTAQCGGEAGYALYTAICTHFLASVSPDSIFEEAEMHMDLGGERFVADSSRCSRRGWLDVENRQAPDRGPIDLRTYAGREGQELPVVGVQLKRRQTSPPDHLKESELLGLMEQHQIGTDASMATHVSNVQKRQYVELDEDTRRLRPSALGLALAHGYALIDQSLVLPSVRARIENQCGNVAKGLVSKVDVVRRTMRTFERKFHDFARRIDALPLMLAVAFAQERGSQQVAGDAAGHGLVMWDEARALQRKVTLEALLEERDRVEMEEADAGNMPPPGEAAERVKEKTEAVQRVQQALEQLGLGPAEPAPQPKAKAARSRPGAGAGNANEASQRPPGGHEAAGPPPGFLAQPPAGLGNGAGGDGAGGRGKSGGGKGQRGGGGAGGKAGGRGDGAFGGYAGGDGKAGGRGGKGAKPGAGGCAREGRRERDAARMAAAAHEAPGGWDQHAGGACMGWYQGAGAATMAAYWQQGAAQPPQWYQGAAQPPQWYQGAQWPPGNQAYSQGFS